MSTPAPSLQPAPYRVDGALPAGHGELPAWKAELNRKLEAHRSRQPKPETVASGRAATSVAAGSSPASRAMAAQVAARVAARYAKEPSYREVLAARAVAAAEAAQGAVVAAERAHQAAQTLLTSVADSPQIEGLVESAEPFFTEQQAGGAKPDTWGEEPGWWTATVSHPEPLPIRADEPERWVEERASEPEPRFPDPRLYPSVDLVAEATVAPAQPLLSKLIEFPRELVAARKPRPRLAEGPLLADSPLEDGQLRIFEVGGVQQESGADRMQERSSSSRAVEEPPYAAAAAPVWHSIRLGEHPQVLETDPASDSVQDQAKAPSAPLRGASMEDRLMASTVDFSLIGMGFLVFVFCFVEAATQVPTGVNGLAAAGAAFAGVYLAYHWLFMSYRGGTPGMRYAEIALCTFEDENPTRKVLRARIGATLLATLPLGLGLLWALFDEDGLGWHDRMTRTYQRSYR